MQRDVKVGLVLGVLLVAVVAVVFFRRDDDGRDKFADLLPAPDEVANKARDILGPSPSDPYPVPPEYLADSWQAPKPSQAANRPAPARSKSGETTIPSDAGEKKDIAKKSDASPTPAVLQPPEFAPPKSSTRSKPDAVASHAKSGGTDMAIRSSSSGREYIIQDGDTLSGIAAHKLGHAWMYPLICEANPQIDPDRLQVGEKIIIPDVRNSQKPAVTATNSTPARTGKSTPVFRERAHEIYEVQENDTLFEIARKRYGKESMYREIFEANRDQLTRPADLRPGMVLRLP